MFILKRYCRRTVRAQKNRRLSTAQKKFRVQTNSNKVEQSERIETNCEMPQEEISIEENWRAKRGDIKLGIIGGGMSPIYASLLLKHSKFVKRINIIDPSGTLADAVCDSSHIDTSTKIKYYGKKRIREGLIGMDILALMDKNDFDMGKAGPVSQFQSCSSYVENMARCMVRCCPSALVAVFARPVTGTLPLVSEIYKSSEWWNPNRIIGSTAIDAMRVESMTASLFDLNPSYLSVPIVAGADPSTVVPLLTKAKSVNPISPEHEAMLIHKLRSADKELACSTVGFKGPSLSTGAAAAKLINCLAGALSGQPNVHCCAYVQTEALPFCRFFANELRFGCRGVEENLGLPKVSSQAIDLIEQSIPHINELSEMAIQTVGPNKTLAK